MRIDNARSNNYQYIYTEISFESGILSCFANKDSIQSVLEPLEYSEERLELIDKLYKRILVIAKNNLTEKQFEILKLYYIENFTQEEIGKKTGTLQNSVCKSLKGNPYKLKDGTIKKTGSLRKLKEIALKDPEVISYLKNIEELKTNKL